MPTLIVEDIPRDVYELIQRQAQARNRTIAEETVRILREGLRSPEATPDELTLSKPLPAEQPTRLPSPSDFILDTGEISAPFDLPRPGPGIPVPTRFGGERLPEPFIPMEDGESNHV